MDITINIDNLIKSSQIMTMNALTSKLEFNISLQNTQTILEKFIDSKIDLVILHIDLVGSTKMSMTLPVDKFSIIIRTFIQEMTLIIHEFNGYVLKFVGDAILAFFVLNNEKNQYAENRPISDKMNSNSRHCKNVINCAYTMINVIQHGINPVLKKYGYHELKVRIGIDFGEIAIVKYGMEVYELNHKIAYKKPHIDMVGYSISIAVKMTYLAKPDHIVIGKMFYDKLEETQKEFFKQLPTDQNIWNYLGESTGGGIYDLYTNVKPG